MARRNITELSDIDFDGQLGPAFYAYSQEAKALGQRLAFELELAASDFKAAGSSLDGHILLFGVDVRLRARRVAKRLKRGQEMARGLGDEGSKFYAAYKKHILSKKVR